MEERGKSGNGTKISWWVKSAKYKICLKVDTMSTVPSITVY